MFQSGEMKEFTDILRDNDEIKKNNLMDDGSANLHILLQRYKPDDKLEKMKKILFGENPDGNTSFTKLKDFWSGLQPDQRAKLKEELSKANKEFLYEGVVDILKSENISLAAPAAADGDNASSQVEGDGNRGLLRTQTGGKSRRRRRRHHHRRTNKIRKSRKGHKMRRSYK
jgi:hypothetical protein